MAKNYVTSFRGEKNCNTNRKVGVEATSDSPEFENFGNYEILDYSLDEEYGVMKKSMSMSDIATLQNDFQRMELNGAGSSREINRPTGAPREQSRRKYVSTAEFIYHYERDIPGRFHSTRPVMPKPQGTGRPGLTIPQSPMLLCRRRARPVHVLSQKEKEEKEIEELKKIKIKAQPIPRSVIEGCRNLPEVPTKPVTIPEPFHLTEVHKKISASPIVQNFKARPAPKNILEKPDVPLKQPIHVRKLLSHKRSQSHDHLKVIGQPKPQTKSQPPHKHNGPVKPVPFSFEKRDEELKKRKEERIKRQIEEEKKQASNFKAQPLPGAVKKVMQKNATKSSSSTCSDNKENHTRFEARIPVVLYKDPFKPILKPTQVKPAPFALTMEKRAFEREQFDKKIKEKEVEMEKLRELKEKEKLKEEEKEKAQLRAKLVHHAKPVPSSVQNPFVPEKSATPITVPETPTFMRRRI